MYSRRTFIKASKLALLSSLLPVPVLRTGHANATGGG